MNMDLKSKKWKAFEIGNIFDVFTGRDLIISRIKKGNIPIISHSVSNNGVAEWSNIIEGQKLFNHNNTISLADRGNFHAYTQATNFYIATRVKALKAKFVYCNKDILRFICLLINQQSVKFSYGNNATNNLRKLHILLPVNEKDEPDYLFMESYMKELEHTRLQEYQQYIKQRFELLKNTPRVMALHEKKWKSFYLKDIFSIIQRGKRLKKIKHIKGNMPYISSKGINNGIDGFIANVSNVRIFANCLSLANSGSVGTCFYQPFSFIGSDHITSLQAKTLNEYSYKFISVLISRLGIKYSFNREINNIRLKREKIILPINANQEPDYEYMESYMKRLEYEKLKQYLDYKQLY